MVIIAGAGRGLKGGGGVRGGGGAVSVLASESQRAMERQRDGGWQWSWTRATAYPEGRRGRSAGRGMNECGGRDCKICRKHFYQTPASSNTETEAYVAGDPYIGYMLGCIKLQSQQVRVS